MKVLKKWTCSIKNYPSEVQISEKRRAKYWRKEDKIPIKYNNSNYIFDKEDFLIEKSTSERVVRNLKTVGTPRYMTINAQKIYVGVHHSVRSKIVNELHELFNKEFKKQLPSKIDLQKNQRLIVTLHFYDAYNNRLPDLDNLANLFAKCGIDCLTDVSVPNQIKRGYTHKLKIITDDKLSYISNIFYGYTDISDPSKKRLDFSLYLVEDDFSIEDLLDQKLEHE